MRTWEWIVIGISVWIGLSALLTALWIMIGAKLLRYPRRHPRRHRRERSERPDWERRPDQTASSTERRPSPR